MFDFSQDADIFLNFDEFGVNATVHSKEVTVLFDLDKDDGSEILLPTIHAKTADVQPLSKGLEIVVDGQNYGVLEWYDLNGITVMACNKEQF